MTKFTPVQRERIIRDIINHIIESEQARGGALPDEEIRAEETRIRTLDDNGLEAMWRSRVGEWLCSIGPEYPTVFDKWETVRQEGEYENPADWQFDKLLTDGDIDYGFQAYRYEPPYTDINPSPEDALTIVNYPDIRESLELILDVEVDAETKTAVLESLDDALGNNADYLTLHEDLDR